VLSDFIPVLNSERDIYRNNYYFSNYQTFSTIFLLQKKRLNPRNYSKQELIMKLFVWATGDDMNMHAKFQIIYKHRYLWTINLISEFLEFCTKIYCAKVSLVKPTVKSSSRRFIQNLFCKFWTFLQVSTNFGRLKQFLEFKTNWKKIKTVPQYWASHSAHGLRCSSVGGPLSLLGRIGTGPGCHDHCGPASPCRPGADAVAQLPPVSRWPRCSEVFA
jgi:hypothetical protein